MPEPGDRDRLGPQQWWKLEPEDSFLPARGSASLWKTAPSSVFQPCLAAVNSQAPTPCVSATWRETAECHFQKNVGKVLILMHFNRMSTSKQSAVAWGCGHIAHPWQQLLCYWVDAVEGSRRNCWRQGSIPQSFNTYVHERIFAQNEKLEEHKWRTQRTLPPRGNQLEYPTIFLNYIF